MRVRVNNGKNFKYSLGDTVPATSYGVKLIVAVDPSKTNMAIMIGDVYGNELEFHELSGKGMDTSYYCQEFRRYIIDLLAGCDIHEFAQEEVIMKKEDEYDQDKKVQKTGMRFFESMKVLTEIRAILIDTSFMLTGKPSKEINNMDWKGAILPDGYRGHEEKGSVRFLCEESAKYIGLTDDVTDVVCIYRHRILYYNSINKIRCDAKEYPKAELEIFIIDEDHIKGSISTPVVFDINYDFDLLDNAIYFANRSNGNGICRIDLGKIKKGDLYKYAIGLYPNSLPYLVTVRKVG